MKSRRKRGIAKDTKYRMIDDQGTEDEQRLEDKQDLEEQQRLENDQKLEASVQILRRIGQEVEGRPARKRSYLDPLLLGLFRK